jgi:Na+-driven multidrug efflux pump
MSNIDFTSDDVRKALWRFSVPMMVFAIMDYVGLFVALGWLMALTNVEQLPATFRIAAAVISLLEALFGGMLAAIYVYANQAFGRKDYPVTRYLINFGFGVTLLISLLIVATGNLTAHYLTALFEVEPVVKQQVLAYLGVLWFGYLFMLLHLYGGLLARMAGAVTVIRRMKISTFVSSMVLCPALIVAGQRYGYDPLQCAAVALVAARLVGLAVMWFDVGGGKLFPFSLGIEFLPRKIFTDWKALAHLGGAETVNGFSLNLSFYLLFLLFSYYEPGTLEAVTVTQYATGFFQAILMGAIGAIIPFAAQNAGGQKIGNIGVGVRWMGARVFVVCVALMIPFILLAPLFIGFFIPDPDIAARALSYIRISSLPWAFLMASFPFMFAIIGIGDTRGTLLLTVWSMYLCNLIPILAVRLLFGGGLVLAAYAESVANVLTFAGCYLYYRRKETQLTRQWQSEAESVAPMSEPGASVGALS